MNDEYFAEYEKAFDLMYDAFADFRHLLENLDESLPIGFDSSLTRDGFTIRIHLTKNE